MGKVEDKLFSIIRTKGARDQFIGPSVHSRPRASHRARNWKWLENYWRKQLPGAEIVLGEDKRPLGIPFSKSAAVNDAAKKAHGDIFCNRRRRCFYLRRRGAALRQRDQVGRTEIKNIVVYPLPQIS